MKDTIDIVAKLLPPFSGLANNPNITPVPYFDSVFQEHEESLTNSMSWDLEAYEHVFKKYSKSHNLELGCGNGRVCIHLAKKNFSIDGIDSSHLALNKFRYKLQGNDLIKDKINIIHGNFLNTFPKPDKEYGLVLLSDLTINLLDKDLLNSLFRTVKYSILKEHGYFSLSFFDDTALTALQKYKGQTFVTSFIDSSKEERLVWQSAKFDPEVNVLHESWYTEEKKEKVLAGYISTLEHKIWTKQELEPIFKSHKFEVMDTFISKIQGGGAAGLEVITVTGYFDRSFTENINHPFRRHHIEFGRDFIL